MIAQNGNGGYGSLAIERKIGEQIAIGDNITVELVEVRRGRARIRVTAPKSVSILRPEAGPRVDEIDANDPVLEAMIRNATHNVIRAYRETKRLNEWDADRRIRRSASPVPA